MTDGREDSRARAAASLAAAAMISRSEFLKLMGGAAVAGAAVGVGGLPALAQGGGTLTVGISSDIKMLDPHLDSLDVFRHTIRSTVFEALTFINPDTLAADPALAKSWEVSGDGLTVTLALQEGVMWHDGKEFVADDVVYTINRVKAPETGSTLAPQLATVASATAVDPHTVKLQLTSTSPGLFAALAPVQIVAERNANELKTAPIGTGPFKFAEWVPGDFIRVEKNANYRIPGKPLLEAIQWRIVPDSQARLSALQDGSLQMVALVEGRDVIQAKSYPEIQVISTKPYVLYEIFNINCQRPPFDDKRMRQALSYAIGREGYVKSVWFGLARPTSNPVPPEMPSHLEGTANSYPYDPEKAASLLAEVGFTREKPLTMEILTPLGFDSLKALSLLLQDSLNKLGHKVAVRELEITVWVDTFVNNRNYDITADNFNTFPEEPTGMYNSGNLAPDIENNINRWNPPGYKEMVDKAAAELDPKKRIELYHALQKYILDEMPMITVDHIPLFFLGSASLKGMVIGPSGIDDYTAITL
jgi:peptide/nickel transport system substrate-binding protein